MRLLILLGFAFWMVACTPSGKQTSSKEALSSDSIQYAQGFTVQRFDTYIMVEVRDPWDSTRLLQRYLLVVIKSEIFLNFYGQNVKFLFYPLFKRPYLI